MLVNLYLVSFHSEVLEDKKFSIQFDFRTELYLALFRAGSKAGPGKRKRSKSQLKQPNLAVPATAHTKGKRQKKGDC